MTTDNEKPAASDLSAAPCSANPSPEMMDAMLKWAQEDKRLSELPELELIKEVLGSDAGDNLAVIELINRLHLGWAEEITDEQNRENTRATK